MAFDLAKTDSMTEAILMSNAVVTQFMNSGTNRYLSLSFEKHANQIIATLASGSVKLIPGYYMLFILVDDIPSVGKIVQVPIEVVKDTIGTAVDQVEGNELMLALNPGSDNINFIGTDDQLKDIKV